MKPDPKTIRVYNEKTNAYKNLCKTDKEIRTEAKFAAMIPDGGIVLDYGCGPGRTAGYFASKGLIAHAFDASEEMIKMASERPGVTAWTAGFHDLDACDTYDGIWASFSLLHAPRSDINALLRAIKTALKTNGAFYLALKLGTGEARDNLGRFYCYYEQEEIEVLLENAGFTWLSHKNGEAEGLDGTNSPWIGVLAHG